MTYLRAPSRISAFDVPSFPASSALRDRTEEATERAAHIRDAGFQEGLLEGRAAAANEVEHAMAEARQAAARLDAAAASLHAATLHFHEREAVAISELEHESLALAIGLAEAIVGREVQSCDAPVLDALRRAGGMLPDRGAPVLRVHPDDEDIVRETVTGTRAPWTDDVTVVADGAIEVGGCVVDVGPCRIDAQITTALERMRATLAPARATAV